MQGGAGPKRKAEDEADDQERAERDKWKDFCVVEEEDARLWVCDIGHGFEHDVVSEEQWLVDDPKLLDPAKVAEARKEELEYMKRRGLWKVVPTPDGITPVSVRWVDVLKEEASRGGALLRGTSEGGTANGTTCSRELRPWRQSGCCSAEQPRRRPAVLAGSSCS